MNHYLKSKHFLGVNSLNGALYCFRCNTYVMDNEFVSHVDQLKDWDLILEKSFEPTNYELFTGLSGIHNMGSTCFMSSVIQSISHNPYIVKYFMDQSHICASHQSITSGSNVKVEKVDSSSCMSCTLYDIINDIYGYTMTVGSLGEYKELNSLDSKLQNKNIDHSFVKFLQCAWKVNNNFTGYTQQDAHEFWQFLLNQLHNDYTKHYGNNHKYNNSSKSFQRHICDCVSHRTFQGFLKSIIKCPHCSNDQVTIDPYMDLSLDISENKTTLYQCLESFHKKEILKDYQFNCNNCSKTSTSVSRKFTLMKIPPVLVIQFKRFRHTVNGKSEKLNNFIEFPAYLNLKDFCEVNSILGNKNNNNKINIIYELFSVISHDGSVDTGHYVSFCKVQNMEWYKFNDNMIQKVSQSDVLKERAYLLFYCIKNFG
ncbi:related to Ubiquitin carboxyl-terminal hydrolase 8 [Saccharomycodes ludwigii]|uniref:Ubiquitin carboxyl-terminal hydrolase n=2 Tax=Saccharomycodes ludwigii TaxID=36035 RepID=A0A376B5I7_9ASCO|nr:related to Ubiquitin carboxyl-terminal hydrolase 8 [Saccharomycodes ludwigii]